jgi:hypothetical protein
MARVASSNAIVFYQGARRASIMWRIPLHNHAQSHIEGANITFIKRASPMSNFDERKSAEESNYVRNEELDFKVVARRNKLLGAWAAGLMGIEGEEAEAYAKSIVMADFEEAGDDDVFRKVKGDLDAKGVEVSEHQVRREMESLLETARAQLTA